MASVTWKKQTTLAWENRFEEPTQQELVEHYNQQLLNVYNAIFEKLRGLGEMNEQFVWMGAPWCWCTLVNPVDMDPERERSWAYVVADREQPLLVMPVDSETMEKLPMRRIKKHVRDFITRGKKVGDITYVEWPIAAKTQLEDIMDMVNRLYRHREVMEQKD
ncbi:MAG: hypothetical protein AAGB34_00740 [Planctomycetota bacterium]